VKLALPFGWECAWSDDDDRLYYFNRGTGESTFTPPLEKCLGNIGTPSDREAEKIRRDKAKQWADGERFGAFAILARAFPGL
jgi:hypothetical protein